MKWMIALLLAAFLAVPALAEEVPAVVPGALAERVEETVYRLTVEETGEVLLLTVDEFGAPLRLETEVPAAFLAEAEQSREGAEAAVAAEYPTGRVLAAEALEDGSRSLSILADDLCGVVVVRSDAIAARALDFGAYAADGQLTHDGARAALALLRPGLVISEIELDEDDGMLVYEGEAILDGSEYEFELSASTGRLLEWERD